MSLMEKFDLETIIRRGMDENKDWDDIVKSITGETSWLFSRGGMGVCVSDTDPEVYEVHLNDGSAPTKYMMAGSEQTWLKLLAVEQFEKYQLQQELNKVKAELEALKAQSQS